MTLYYKHGPLYHRWILAEPPSSAIRGRAFVGSWGPQENSTLPTDQIGTCSITINNMVVGSRYRIEVTGDGATVADGVAATADVVVSVPYYAAGNANNSLRVKVRKATAAPKYQPFESFVTAAAAGGSVYVAQVPDPIA